MVAVDELGCPRHLDTPTLAGRNRLTAIARPLEPGDPATVGSDTRPTGATQGEDRGAHPAHDEIDAMRGRRTDSNRPASTRPSASASRTAHRAGRAVAATPAATASPGTTCGNTRPLEPTKVGSPNPAHHVRRSSGPKAASAGASRSAAGPYRERNADCGSLWVRFRPPRPASRNLRPTDGMWSWTVTLTPSARRALRQRSTRPARAHDDDRSNGHGTTRPSIGTESRSGVGHRGPSRKGTARVELAAVRRRRDHPSAASYRRQG